MWQSQSVDPNITFVKAKLVFLRTPSVFRLNRLPEDIVLRHDSLQITKSWTFVADRLCYEMTGVSRIWANHAEEQNLWAIWLAGSSVLHGALVHCTTLMKPRTTGNQLHRRTPMMNIKTPKRPLLQRESHLNTPLGKVLHTHARLLTKYTRQWAWNNSRA